MGSLFELSPLAATAVDEAIADVDELLDTELVVAGELMITW
jgi:hypothetical protein